MEYAYLSNDFFQIQVQALVIQIIQVQAYQCIANSISYRTRKSNKYLFLEKLDVDKVDYVQCQVLPTLQRNILCVGRMQSYLNAEVGGT